METIEIIFKVGTEFHKACKEYLLIKKVDELQYDIELIKGSFFGNALDFVEKASVCENNNNIRFFLESAYSNFSQSVKMYVGSVDKFIGVATSYAIKEGIADSIKSEGANDVSKYYNKAVDGVIDKATASDKVNAERCEKECEILEMSYVGKAMCEYYLKEYSLCMESIDSAIGIHIEPYIKTINTYSALIPDDFWDTHNFVILKVLHFPIVECMGYLVSQKSIASCYRLSLEQLRERNRIVKLLRSSADKGDFSSWRLLREINE